jgi:alkylated DNA nucleotide flippase Atl1
VDDQLRKGRVISAANIAGGGAILFGVKTRKSWREKMDNPNLPKLVAIPRNMQKQFGPGIMLLPSPQEVDALIREVPEGRVITISQVRQSLAREHSADTTCPLVTGIFIRIAAEAAEEEARAGKREITSYWRVVRNNGTLNPKFPGGVKVQAQKLLAEGHQLSKSGKGDLRVIMHAV